jgi:hypothetical protein
MKSIYAQDLGRSEFLRDLDASFSLSVQRSKPVGDGAEVPSIPKDVVEGTGAETGSIDSGIDVAIVLNILKPFGDLRSFKFSRQEVNQDLASKITSYTRSFLIISVVINMLLLSRVFRRPGLRRGLDRRGQHH